MNKDLIHDIHLRVVSAADHISGKLPPDPERHPKGRIPVAHIYHVIKSLMGVPARECTNARYEDICQIIEFCRNNPEEKHVVTALRSLYNPEKVYELQRKSIKEFT